MSAQLFNPKSKRLVNIDPKQMKALQKAGWLSPTDPKTKKALAELAEGKEGKEGKRSKRIKTE